MFNFKNGLLIGSRLTLATAIAVIFGTGTSIALAQTGDDSTDLEAPDTEVIDNVVVTGTRLQLAPSQMAKQIITITKEDLTAIGEPTLERALQRLPQNFGGASGVSTFGAGFGPGGGIQVGGAGNINAASTINLRGLEGNGTLVLIDGRRIGSSGHHGSTQDISTIPMAMVERIEIQLDGASAIYGADAIGGVVNIITRKDIDTLTTTLRYDDSTEMGTPEYNMTLVGGTGWGSGRLTAALGIFDQAAVKGKDLGFVPWGSGPGTRFSVVTGEPDIVDFIFPSSPPSVLLDNAVEYQPMTQTGGGSTPGIGDFTAGNGTNTSADSRTIIPQIRKYSFDVMVDQEVTENIDVFAGAHFVTQDTYSSFGYRSISTDLAAGDPRNPFPNDDILVNGFYPAFGEAFTNAESDTYGLTVGLDWSISEKWDISVAAYSDRSELDSIGAGGIDSNDSNIDSTFIPWGDGTANYDTPWSWTGTDANGNPVAMDGNFIDYLKSNLDLGSSSTNKSSTIELNVRGGVWDLPGGTIKVGAGIEYRDESLVLTSKASGVPGATGDGVDFNSLNHKSDYFAGFAEVFVPIFGQNNGFVGMRELNFQAAVRAEDTSIVGEAVSRLNRTTIEDSASSNSFDQSTYSLGLVWSPAEQVRLKANVSTSFIAPENSDLYKGITDINFRNYNNRNICQLQNRGGNGTEAIYGEFRDWCFVPFLFRNPNVDPTLWWQESDYIYRAGGNPDLLPQEGEHTSIAAEITPTDNLKISVNWHRSEITNKPVAVQSVLAQMGEQAYDLMPQAFEFWDNGDVKTVFYNTINLDEDVSESIDYRIQYATDTSFGNLSLDAMWSVELERFERLGQGVDWPAEELIGTRIPSENGQFRVSWDNGGWYASVDSIYRGKLYDRDFYTSTTQRPKHTGDISRAYWLTNIQGSYSFSDRDGMLDNVIVSMGVNNLLKTEPETDFYFDGEKVGTYDATFYGSRNPRLQTFFLSISKEW